MTIEQINRMQSFRMQLNYFITIVIFVLLQVSCNSSNQKDNLESKTKHTPSPLVKDQPEVYTNFDMSELQKIKIKTNGSSRIRQQAVNFYENIDNSKLVTPVLYTTSIINPVSFSKASSIQFFKLSDTIKINHNKDYELMAEVDVFTMCDQYYRNVYRSYSSYSSCQYGSDGSYYMCAFKDDQFISVGFTKHKGEEVDTNNPNSKNDVYSVGDSYLFDASYNGNRIFGEKQGVKLFWYRTQILRIRKIGQKIYGFFDRQFVGSSSIANIAVSNSWDRIGVATDGRYDCRIVLKKMQVAYLSTRPIPKPNQNPKIVINDKLSELKQFQLSIGNKLVDIINLINNQEQANRVFKDEILAYKEKNNIRTLTDAQKIPGIRNNLKLLQENHAIKYELIKVANATYGSYEDLKFLVRRNERELTISKVFSKEELQVINKTLDDAKTKYLPETKEFVMPNIKQEDLPSMENMWLSIE